jgi:hypothetical protein
LPLAILSPQKHNFRLKNAVLRQENVAFIGRSSTILNGYLGPTQTILTSHAKMVAMIHGYTPAHQNKKGTNILVCFMYA